MNSLMRALVVLIVLSLGLSPLAAQKPENTQGQSPPRPSPEWLKIIDQGNNDPRLKGYLTPEGIKVEIVADFPTVRNPVAMTFGIDGTLYVLEWGTGHGREVPDVFTFKDIAPHLKDAGIKPRSNVASLKSSGPDVVKILRDSKVKGVYNDSQFLRKDEARSGIMWHDGWLYVAGWGKVLRYKQKEIGGPYDLEELIVHGILGFNKPQPSGISMGNDGWVYIAWGLGDTYLQGSDKSRASLASSGAISRCRPDGSRLHAYSIGYCDPYGGVVFDVAGNIFHADSEWKLGDKYGGCRLMHVAEDSDFGWRPSTRFPLAPAEKGSDLLPGRMPPMLRTGHGAPSGLLIYNDTRFPEPYRGLLYYPDVARQLIRAYRVEPKGATFEVVEEFEFLKSADPLFRPCQMVVGPDGAMYVCDWRTESGEPGELASDGKHGRIYRLTWSGTKDQPALPPRAMESWAKIPRLSDEELLKTLESEDHSDRQWTQRELTARGDKNRPGLLKLLAAREVLPPARFAALGALQSLWNQEVRAAVLKLLNDPEEDMRRLAANALALNCPRGDKDAHEALLQRLGDNDPAVRRAVALAIGRIAAPGADDNLVTAYKFDEGKDVFLHDGLIRAIERLGKPGIAKLMDLADSGVQKDLDKAVEAFLVLRTPAAAEAIPALLRNPHLTKEQRDELARAAASLRDQPGEDAKPGKTRQKRNP